MIALAGVIGLIAFFNARDTTTVAPAGTSPTTSSQGPGTDLVAAGNVELLYGRAGDGRALRALADRLGTADSPALRQAGQAVVVKRDSGVAGIEARSSGATLRVTAPTDPRLGPFVEQWLGRAAGT